MIHSLFWFIGMLTCASFAIAFCIVCVEMFREWRRDKKFTNDLLEGRLQIMSKRLETMQDGLSRFGLRLDKVESAAQHGDTEA